ncbi:hypothetical protein OAE03_02795 [Winogradskyella sp.]|uniref:hypothetical protein n=1 Tax=Winogradskyella sp. TaxID=1883156 RepID=UPI0023395C55|nr:hypothetical protein [Winogradskyella sp.]MDC1229942.1 hypothetical protein [bacterium]MDB9720988.1 hypothetical protein [Winogradskyella sp.]MDB9755596.1 hypothetical protein [Winogradskyella sp.]MDC0006416.1 hypothetical protein [Winogradskyella sp.]MDC0009465.1 hypothetical protein [Winogradskyella sp.]|tara:strand:+ start:13540 stop:13767 length:228 start_codon:yes stop_codon:yes gene_type:complete
MELPKFILGDNTDHPDAIYIIHTEFPRFIINLENDEVEWFEEFDQHDEKELETETENYIQQATDFYDREVERYDD